LVPDNSPFDAFEDAKLNLFLNGPEAIEHNKSSPLRNPALKQVLSDELIGVLQELLAITKLLNASPKFSEHDMLVYDRRRASIQHQLANVAVPPLTTEPFNIFESCRQSTIVYSILTLWGFTPLMNLYKDLGKNLLTTLQAPGRICMWGVWWEILLWNLFIGGHAMFGRQERSWFSTMIRETLRERNLVNWLSVRNVLGLMPVYHTLWEPFQTLWLEAMSPGPTEHATLVFAR
jgi:hypothetical protein